MNGVASADATRLIGSVDRITFFNPQTGFSVLRLRVRGRREQVTVVGILPAAQPGERLVAHGHWQTDPRHGAQFRTDQATVEPPLGGEDIVRYLGSGLIRQIGPVLAKRIVAAFGSDTLAVLDAEPERVQRVPGIGQQRARSIVDGWRTHQALRAVSGFLSEHGLDTRFAPRLVAAYGEQAAATLRANPYRLVGEVPGLGFRAADRLGAGLGVRPSAPPRVQAAVQAVLLRAAEQGHTRQGAEQLIAASAALTGLSTELVQPAVRQLEITGVIGSQASTRSDPTGAPLFAAVSADVLSAQVTPRLRVYEPVAPPNSEPVQLHADTTLGLGFAGLVRAEEQLAERVTRLASRQTTTYLARLDAWLAADSSAAQLSDEQRAAVRIAASNGCSILTGGPGTGKTTTIQVLVRALAVLDRAVVLAAPTGKAAQRLSEVAGAEARTVHRLLGARPSGFRHGPREPVPADVIVVDEASMLDTQLARALVSAVGPTSQLILVGDAEQLPSVGPGQVLRDLLNSGTVPAAHLDTVFRQAARSQIVTNAHRIRRGEPLHLPPASALLTSSDCVFVPVSADRIADLATDWAARRLPSALGCTPTEVQCLAPLTRVCQVLNSSLQATLNPAAPDRPERPHGALPLRQGDRVIQTRNNYRLEVFNGDVGTLVSVEPELLTVDFGDSRLVGYGPADVLDLDHAYALTVHRSQGSEWAGVVVLLLSSFGPMLTRNLLYTALTRGRRAAVLLGERTAIERAVAETRDAERLTGLASLLRFDRDGPSEASD
jgi:exodeoxyribonuclease V alpha subunit